MKIGIIGCAGRMGCNLIREVLSNNNAELSGGLEQPDSEHIGKDLGVLAGLEETGILVSDNPDEVIAASDALINFTLPEPTMEIARKVSEAGKAHIIGTTGLSDEQRAELSGLAKNSVIMHAHNMSVGVNLLLNLVEEVAGRLPKESFDIEVVEMHHNQKVDAPSGTALSLGEAAASGRGTTLNESGKLSREGQVGARIKGEIGFATLRGGGVVGDHTVIFASENERIELTHKAQDRSVFASGAVRAALWAEGKDPGLYSMQDVLDL